MKDKLVRDVMSLYDRSWPTGLPEVADGQVSELDLVLNEATDES